MKLLHLILLISVACVIVFQKVQAAPPADIITSLPSFPRGLKSKNYGGYINVNGSDPKNNLTQIGGTFQMYYYFIESERSPSSDPLLLWLNGGPGCSSLLGLFTEVGPFLLRHGGLFYNNSYHWAREMNVLYLESPAGVGFSTMTADASTFSWTDALTAQLNYNALSIWLQSKFPEYKGRGFYIAGESYAGHYIPQLAERILHGPDDTLRAMMKGFMAGNPCTGTAIPSPQPGYNQDWCFTLDEDSDPTLPEFFQGHAFMSFDSRITSPDLVNNWDPGDQYRFDVYDILVRYCQMNTLDKVVRWNHPVLHSWRFKGGRAGAEKKLQSFSDASISEALYKNIEKEGLRMENKISAQEEEEEEKKAQQREEKQDAVKKVGAELGAGEPMGPPPIYGACGDYYLGIWLNRKDVQIALHVISEDSQSTKKFWSECADIKYPTPGNMPGVVDLYQLFMDETNWNLMLYSGDNDAVVNFVQTEKIVIAMNRNIISNFTPWFYRDVFNSTWKQLGGWYVRYDRVSWASVRGCGHMVPTYNPPAALQLLQSFVETGRPGQEPVTWPSSGSVLPMPSSSPCDEKEQNKKLFGVAVVCTMSGGFVALLIVLCLKQWKKTGGQASESRERGKSSDDSLMKDPNVDTSLYQSLQP